MLPTKKILKGSAANLVRLLLSIVVGLVLPPLLVHRLPPVEYSAWVLVLQLTSYISMLDLGLQGVIGKLVAENHARGDHESNHHLLNTAVVLLSVIALIGLAAVAVMVWQVPRLFSGMPAWLMPQVRLGLAILGGVSAVSLPANPFISTFTGLQEYGFPTRVALANRIATAVLLVVLVLHNGTFVELTCAYAVVGAVTAVAQVIGWRRYVYTRVAFTLWRMQRAAAAVLLKSGGVIALWTLGGLFINGLDLVIVGHLDYPHTGAYALAATVTNFMLMLIASVITPLLPAVSAMQVHSTPEQIGDMTVRITRYCTLMLVAISAPILIFSTPLLTLWVGPVYAQQIVPFLQWLILSNCLRQLGYPYSVVVVATGRQNLATLATISEAVVNLSVSVYLAHHMGALGVALGTFFGSLVSLALHWLVSMPHTRPWIAFSRRQFFRTGVAQPLLSAAPLLAMVVAWRLGAMPQTFRALPILGVAVGLGTIWQFGLTAGERTGVLNRLRALSPAAARLS